MFRVLLLQFCSRAKWRQSTSDSSRKMAAGCGCRATQQSCITAVPQGHTALLALTTYSGNTLSPAVLFVKLTTRRSQHTPECTRPVDTTTRLRSEISLLLGCCMAQFCCLPTFLDMRPVQKRRRLSLYSAQRPSRLKKWATVCSLHDVGTGVRFPASTELNLLSTKSRPAVSHTLRG